MSVPPATTLVALGCLAAVLPTSILLDRARRGSARPQRAGYLLLLIGAVLAASTAAAPSLGALIRPAILTEAHFRMGLSTAVGIGFGLAGALLLAGFLYLPGVAGSARERLRRFLDGGMVSASLVFLGWTFVVSPTKPPPGTVARLCANAAVPSSLALLVAGVVAISAGWAARPRRGLVLAAAGATLAICAGAGMTGALCHGHWSAVAWSGVACLSGLLLLGVGGAYAADGPARAGSAAGGTGSLVPIFAVLAIGLAGFYSTVLRGQRPHVASLVIGGIAGLALLARQTLAVHDVRWANARLAVSEAHYRQLAHTDPLTGLANRRGLLRVMEQEMVGDRSGILLAFDLDCFKNINDMRGHDVGDAVLGEIGRRLRGHLRSGDLAARLGGDEFAVLLWAPPDRARQLAERLLDLVSRPYQHETGTIYLSASVGLACGDSADSVARLLRNADLALRYAKLRGKARIEHYQPTYEVALRRRTTVEHELRWAIERHELHLAFQPVVALPSVRPVGAEALLRWQHPRLGSVPPDEFIPIAEESGLILRLGNWVLHRACHQLSRWLADGHDVWVSVNVSIPELHSRGYVDAVADALRAHRVPPQRLVLEVTEHDVALDIKELAARLGDLRSTGVRVALDDFGAGYSSLGQLHRLPVDILKIDRGLLVEPAPDSGVSPAPLVQVAVSLGQRLGLTVIAEGVEEVAQRRLLEAAGCPYAQGIVFGRAMPAEHVEAMLAAAVPRRLPSARRAEHDGIRHGPGRVGPGQDDRAQDGSPQDGSPHDGSAQDDRAQDDRAQNVGPVDSGREMRQA